MDNYREVKILAQKSITDSGTETIDINVDEPITELRVLFAVTNDAAVADEVPPESCVSKIELVDGGTVYSSLSGREATAVSQYEKSIWPRHSYTAEANGWQEVVWALQFGRYVGDEEFAFSPTRLLNPQLKVTWAKNALHVADSCYLEVLARTMQGISLPSKALLTKTIKAWSTAGSGYEECDLPTDYPYRRLYFRAYEKETWFGTTWKNFELNCDVGKLIVFDLGSNVMRGLMKDVWGLARYQEYVEADNGVMHQSHLGECKQMSCVPTVPSMNVYGNPTTPGYVRMYAYNMAGAAQTDIKTQCEFVGLCPENAYCYPFGRQDDPATWFNAPRYGSVKLIIEEGSAGAAASVFLQQPRPLP